MQRAKYLTHEEIKEKAEIYAATSFFDNIEDENDAYVIIDAGNELGIPPFQAMKGIYILTRTDKSGRTKKTITYSGTLIASMIKSSGKYTMNHTFEGEGMNLTCKITIIDSSGEASEVTFSMADAKKAGLLDGYNKDNYNKYPRNMLYNRCIANVAKWQCADIFGGVVYTPEELADDYGVMVNEDGEPMAKEEKAKTKASSDKKADKKKELSLAEMTQLVKEHFLKEEYEDSFPNFASIGKACATLKITMNPDKKKEDKSLELVTHTNMIEKLEEWVKGQRALNTLKEGVDLGDEDESEQEEDE